MQIILDGDDIIQALQAYLLRENKITPGNTYTYQITLDRHGRITSLITEIEKKKKAG